MNIGLMTSGGDAPGMNACIRAITRMALHHNLQITGILGGYQGILNKQFSPLHTNSVANIIKAGGTILKTARFADFHQGSVRKKAHEILKAESIDALICIGGDGSFAGLRAFGQENNFPCIGIPATIDNDISGTDYTIGFDTAVNTALDAIDRIRDTATSHDRLFIVEVMGRDSGFIALDVGIAGGAEEIFTPEKPLPLDIVIDHIKKSMARGKKSSILITAEGQKPGRAYDLAEAIRKKSGFESKVCILGHIQRGGAPTARDRVLASRLGAAAIDCLMQNQSGLMLGIQNEKIVTQSLDLVGQKKKQLSNELLSLAQILSA